MSTITCPYCLSEHDTSNRVTGDVVFCRCSVPLLVQHGHSAIYSNPLRPVQQHDFWSWMEAEVAALWLEIYRNYPDLDDAERVVEADKLYADPPAVLIETLVFALQWDAQVAKQRSQQ